MHSGKTALTRIVGVIVVVVIIVAIGYFVLPMLQQLGQEPAESTETTETTEATESTAEASTEVAATSDVSENENNNDGIVAPTISDEIIPGGNDDTGDVGGSSSTVTSVSLNKTDITLFEAGESARLSLTVRPENASHTATWDSSDDSVATVSSSGLVTAVSKGTVNVTATVEGKTATCIVRVNISSSSNSEEEETGSVTSITLDKTDITLAVGESAKLNASGTSDDVTWSSSDSSIATVGDTGLVTAVSGGTVNITVTSGNATATCIVRVKTE